VPNLTQVGAVLGTPRYMSPEQLAGEAVDARSDLYSAALVIHEALTGELPYVRGKTLCELCPDASPVLQDLLDRCLKQNPAQRPANAVEVYLRLQELGKASGVLLLPPGAMDKLLSIRRRPTDPTVAAPAPPPGPATETGTTTASVRRQRRRMLLVALTITGLLTGAMVAAVALLR
jgi:serine/threonine-protein kinase